MPGEITLSENEKERYARHLILPEIGAEGQSKLKNSSVLIVGVGGLGSPIGLYLAAAGVGRIGLIDPDEVSVSNLQRQILYSESDVGSAKIFSAEKRLKSLNSEIEVRTYPEKLSTRNALDLLGQYDWIVDGSDNFDTRYLINDACLVLKKSWVYGAVSGFDAQVGLFSPGEPCYRCLYPENPDQGLILNCDRNGVLGVVPGLAGMIQATEVLKKILGLGEPMSGKVLAIDTLRMSFDTFQFAKRPKCLCAAPPSTLSFHPHEVSLLQYNDLSSHLEKSSHPVLLIDVRTKDEFLAGHLEGAVHVGLLELEKFADDLGEETEVIVYCQGKTRSAHASQVLTEQGVSKVFQLVLPENKAF